MGRRRLGAAVACLALARGSLFGAAADRSAKERTAPRKRPTTRREGPQRALLLVGAAYDVTADALEAFARFARADETLALLKGVHFDGSVYAPSEMEALRRTVRETLKPVFADVRPGDSVSAPYYARARDAAACVWPSDGHDYRAPGERKALERRAHAWWGVLQAAHDALAKREAARGARFAQVVTARPDVRLTAPLRAPDRTQRLYVYAPADPPDALWIFGNRVAAQAVLTVFDRVAACAAVRGCCARTFADVGFWQSWFPFACGVILDERQSVPTSSSGLLGDDDERLCWAADRLYPSGVRIVADREIAGTIRKHHAKRQNLTHNPKNVRTTFLRSEAYDPQTHGLPAGHVCGPWRPARHV